MQRVLERRSRRDLGLFRVDSGEWSRRAHRGIELSGVGERARDRRALGCTLVYEWYPMVDLDVVALVEGEWSEDAVACEGRVGRAVAHSHPPQQPD